MAQKPQIPQDLVSRIVEAVRNGQYHLTNHVFERMAERGIGPKELQDVVLQNTPIEYNPARSVTEGDGILFYGLSEVGCHLHVKVVEDPRKSRVKHFILTAYEPDEDHFEPDFKTRKGVS
jgi:hypothetical protein